MKKITLLAGFICCMGAAFSQSQSQPYDSSFRVLYKAVALHPGYMNRRGLIHDSIVKRWDRDIKIYIEGSSSKNRREVLNKLKSTIATITPALNNKIQISFTDDKSSANYVIDLNYRGLSGWYLKWDALGNIYNCIVHVNGNEYFNYEQQAGLVSHYFYQSLGDFVFKKKNRAEILKSDPAIASNVSVWRQDINNIDLQILKVHYADDIKPGMAEKDIDQFFARHSN